MGRLRGQTRWEGRVVVTFAVIAVFVVVGCSRTPPAPPEELRQFPLDTMEGVLTRSGVEHDKAISSDGKGSLKIAATQPTTVRLFEVTGVTVDNARLIYQAKLRTADVKGKVFLEMWCRFPGKGEFFSRALESPLSGTTEWTAQETPFFLQPGDKPDLIKLNLVVDGTGTVWIDDVRLAKGPLQ